MLNQSRAIKKHQMRNFVRDKPSTPYIYHSAGPIIITAPHTLPVDRKMADGEFKVVHKREK